LNFENATFRSSLCKNRSFAKVPYKIIIQCDDSRWTNALNFENATFRGQVCVKIDHLNEACTKLNVYLAKKGKLTNPMYHKTQWWSQKGNEVEAFKSIALIKEHIPPFKGGVVDKDKNMTKESSS
jgi:hypothetical protein